MKTKTDKELLAEANALDAAYASAAEFDAKNQPTKTIWKVSWDNGVEACGAFPDEYDTEEEAEQAAEDIYYENLALGVWGEDAVTEAISVEIPVDLSDGFDEYTEIRKAGLNHRGQP